MNPPSTFVPPSCAGIRFQVLTHLESINAHREAWEVCISSTGGDIYFAPDWLSAWMQECSGSGQFWAILGWIDDRIVGLIPFSIESLWVGPVRVRLARLAGTDPNYPIMGLPLPFETDPEIAKTVFTTAMTCLVGSMRCQAISLSPLSELAPGVAAIRSCIGDAGLETAAEDWSGRHTVMRLPDSFDAWLESLSKSRRREYRKDLGKLAERGALSMRTTTALTLADRLQAFAEMHTAQWREVGKAGHFGDWPDALPFGRLVSASLAPSGRASIDEHWCEKTLLSAQYGFRQGSRAYWRLIARTLDPDLRKFGVGRVGLVERVRHLIADGVQMVEAGSGEYDYKLNYGGELVPIGRLVLSSRKARGRVRLLLRAASLLDLVYYRFWFLKVAPQIRRLTGLAPRPLWRTWRKTRL